MPKNRSFYGCAMIAFVFFAGSRSHAQKDQLFQYASKFLCGTGDGLRTVPGRYLTAINIHNPADERVAFDWKVAVALPLQGAQVVSPFAPLELIPDGAGDLTCKQILEQSHHPAPFMTGFVVIESKTELDVVAVYTATDPTGKSISIEVKPTAARLVPPPKFPDLIVGGNCQSATVTGSNATGFIATAIIQNVGAAPAGASVTRFIFTPSGGGASTSTDINTPSLAAGASVNVSAPVPATCFEPNCKVDVMADATNLVVESNENNNFDTATCIGWVDKPGSLWSPRLHPQDAFLSNR
jgi:CARDB protein